MENVFFLILWFVLLASVFVAAQSVTTLLLNFKSFAARYRARLHMETRKHIEQNLTANERRLLRQIDREERNRKK